MLMVARSFFERCRINPLYFRQKTDLIDDMRLTWRIARPKRVPSYFFIDLIIEQEGERLSVSSGIFLCT